MFQRLFAHRRVVIQDPSLAKAFFADTQFAWLWLLFRGYIGYDWLSHGLEKLHDPKWMVTGESLKA
ncbi:MAG: DoxX family protein, partial [Chloroflexi bacterium]|nr:DoxX family protein [Chloroflexota bacterium]